MELATENYLYYDSKVVDAIDKAISQKNQGAVTGAVAAGDISQNLPGKVSQYIGSFLSPKEGIDKTEEEQEQQTLDHT